MVYVNLVAFLYVKTLKGFSLGWWFDMWVAYMIDLGIYELWNFKALVCSCLTRSAVPAQCNS